MKSRKQTSTEPMTDVCKDENGIVNLTGSTLKISMRNADTGAMVFSNQTATIVSPTAGTWQYLPTAGDVANYGTFQLEVTETRLSGQVVTYPQSGYYTLIIEPILSAVFVPPPGGIFDHSISLLMLAQQSPGAVLIYDASGNAAVLADVAVGKVMLSGGVGVPPSYGRVSYTAIQDVSATNVLLARRSAGAGVVEEAALSGTAVGRFGVMELIGRINVAAVASYTSPSWTAGKYAQIIVDIDGAFSGGGYLDFRANNDSTLANYVDQGADSNSVVSGDSAFKTEGAARCLVVGTAGASWHDHITFNPLTTGRARHGTSHGTSDASGAAVTSGYSRLTGFQWRDTATDVTFVTLLTQAGTMTATGYVWGILA